jgi:hypothetical protein
VVGPTAIVASLDCRSRGTSYSGKDSVLVVAFSEVDRAEACRRCRAHRDAGGGSLRTSHEWRAFLRNASYKALLSWVMTCSAG